MFSFSFIDRPEVCRRGDNSLSDQLRKEAKGTRPEAFKAGRSCKFVDYEIDACMAAELNGASDDQLRALVLALIGVRRFVSTKEPHEFRAIIADLVLKHSAPGVTI